MPFAAPAPARGRTATGVSDRAYRSLSLAIAGLALSFYTAFIARSAFTVGGRTYFSLFDDAMVSMRYARNLAHGAGLAWNAGQHPVEGYTNLLWTVWMAVLHLTGVSDAKVALLVMLSGAAILIAELFVVRAIAETLRPGRRDIALVAMAVTGAYYPLTFWTLRGMEVGLIALLCSAMVLLALRLEHRFARTTLAKLALVAAAGVLTRDDVVLPCLVVAAFVLIRCDGHRKLAAAVLAGTLAATIGAHEVFRLAYYGDAMPNTYYLKLGGIDLGTRLSRGGAAVAAVGVRALLAPLVLAAAAFAVRFRRVPAGQLLLATIVLVQSAYSAYVGGDAWEFFGITNRFLTPVVPLLLILAAVGFVRLHDAGRARVASALTVSFAAIAVVFLGSSLNVAGLPRIPYTAQLGQRESLICAAAALLVAMALTAARARAPSSRMAPALLALALALGTSGEQMLQWGRGSAIYSDRDAKAARYGVALRRATSPETSIAVVWAGAIPYFDHRPSVDLLGKSDTVIARERPHPGALRPGHMKWDYAHSIGRLHPDVVAQLWYPAGRPLELLRRFGYVRVWPTGGDAYVRRGVPLAHRAALARAADW